MISIVATTAFFTAVTADSNLTWRPLFELKYNTLDAPQPELQDETCFDLTEKGIGNNLQLAKYCKEVTDYDLQCAGKDLEGLPTSTATEEQTTGEVEGERRLSLEEEEGNEEVEAEPDWAAIWESHKTKIYDENIKEFGELVACIQRNRYYNWYWWNSSWLYAKYAKFTCLEMIAKYGDESCDSSSSKAYALNVCCPATCGTSEILGCPTAQEEAIIEDAVMANETGEKKEGEACEDHSDCGANLQCGSESRPKTPAPTTEEPTTPTEAPASAEPSAEASTEGSTEGSTEVSAEVEAEAVRLLANEAVETEETEEVTKKDETVETETEEAAQKKCQKESGASYYGFGFVAVLLAVVSL